MYSAWSGGGSSHSGKSNPSATYSHRYRTEDTIGQTEVIRPVTYELTEFKMADLSCGASCSKYMLFIFNFIFFLAGGTVLGIGIWILVDKSSFIDLTKIGDDIQSVNAPGVIEAAAYTLIAAGVITFVIAFLGCCGAIKEWRPMLIMYAVFLLIILILEIAAGIAVAVFRGQVDTELKKFMNMTLVEGYTGNNSDPITSSWDAVQYLFQCCGVTNATDYTHTQKWTVKQTDWLIPPSCCKADVVETLNDEVLKTLTEKQCMNLADIATSNSQTGCFDSVSEWIKKHSLILVGVGIGLGLVQIFGIIFACALCTAIGKSQSNAV